ncbi:MAG: hypothetical protein ACJAWM_000720 [Sulfitobacter sp.]|jgi:hypothetical protein
MFADERVRSPDGDCAQPAAKSSPKHRNGMLIFVDKACFTLIFCCPQWLPNPRFTVRVKHGGALTISGKNQSALLTNGRNPPVLLQMFNQREPAVTHQSE